MLRRLFYLRKSDRLVVVALLCVVVAALGVLFLMGSEPQAVAPIADSTALGPAPLLPRTASARPQAEASADNYPTARPAERFPFDPNTADSTQLLRLGLQPWQVRNIYKYRARGGIYRTKEDFARVYGLTAGLYRELEPYISISPDYQPAATLVAPPAAPDTVRRLHKIGPEERVVLNEADTLALQRVPGIGGYYARRIYDYGQRLGGYVSVDQLDEVDGLPAGVKRYFVVSRPAPRRLNVNRLSLNELKRHPYINYYQARAITDYRRQSGPLKSLRELSLSPDFPEAAILRLEPYVEY